MTAPPPARSPDCPVGARDCDGPGTYRCDEFVWGSGCRHWQARNGGYLAPEGIEEEPASAAEQLARRFHEAYERLAPAHGYATREASAKPWRAVPVRNRLLMIAVAEELLSSGVELRA